MITIGRENRSKEQTARARNKSVMITKINHSPSTIISHEYDETMKQCLVTPLSIFIKTILVARVGDNRWTRYSTKQMLILGMIEF